MSRTTLAGFRSGIIDTRAFVNKNDQRFRHIFQSKTETISKRIAGLDGVYSLKQLTESSV